MKRYGWTAAGICLLYGWNRFVLIPNTTGTLHELLLWHGADFLAGGLILCILYVLLLLAGEKAPLPLWQTVVFLLLCGIFWEVITPLYLSRSTGDPWDVLAYLLGGLCLWAIEKKTASIE